MSNDRFYDGKVIWITGASSGIGEALALEFANQGATLILSARREQALLSVKQRCSEKLDEARILVLPLDVTDQAAIDQASGKAKAFAGRIDMLINNAGISQRSSCLTTDINTYRALFEVDVFGQIALTKAVLPIMIGQGSGHIAIMASVAGKIGVPYRTGYSAAKHAVMGFFDSLRSEVSHHDIRVSTIVPGFIRTRISNNALSGDGQTYGRTDSNIADGMSAQDCAAAIVKGLANGKTEIAVGKGLEMHALWIKRFFPKLIEKLLVDQYKKRAETDNFT